MLRLQVGGGMTGYPTGRILTDCIPGVDSAELVQKGGQKAVYRATHGGQTFALKVIAIDPGEPADEDIDNEMNVALQRARREVAILEQIDVPVLAKQGPLGLSTITIGDANWLYFTEEWIEGRGLSSMIRDGRLQPCQVAQMGVDLVQAACWLWTRGMIHRDIKPANLMWAVDRSRFVLLDTGIALDLYGPSLTLGHIPVGTVPYLSPEQMEPSRKRTLDFRSDLFAIGVVLYEAAAAEHPFMTVGTTPSQVLAGILTTTPPLLVDRLEGFPQDLNDLVARLMAKSPHLRYRTCKRALAAVEKVASSLGVRV